MKSDIKLKQIIFPFAVSRLEVKTQKMQATRKLLIYNQFNKGVLSVIKQRSTIAAPVAQCPYAETTTSDNQIVVARANHEVAEKYLPYSQVPGPKPIPILGNTWR